MSNPILTTTNSKLDTRVKEPSGIGSLTLDRFSLVNQNWENRHKTPLLIFDLFNIILSVESTMKTLCLFITIVQVALLKHASMWLSFENL